LAQKQSNFHIVSEVACGDMEKSSENFCRPSFTTYVVGVVALEGAGVDLDNCIIGGNCAAL
jgi:hypothetical protein